MTPIISIILYLQPIQCQSGNGCPDWAWKEYLEYKEEHPEEYMERWIHVSEGLPTDGKPRLILNGRYVMQATYKTRAKIWEGRDFEDWVPGEQIEWYRDLPPMPEDEANPRE